jgi:large subunit ribosomal protein L17
MRHSVFGKQLNRDTGQRQALLKGLAGALIRSEAIETTEAKAKAAQGLIEKLINKAKTASLTNIRHIESVITDKALVQKLVQDIAPRFKNRSGGYLRLIKLGTRTGDNAPIVRMELTAPTLPKPSVKN